MAFKDTWKNKIDDQDYIKADDINGIAKEVISIEEDSEKIDHRKLKNLSFEESGHTGFQKELTEEQLESLEIVKNKEDKSNKISSWDEYTGAENYPTCDMMSNFVSQEQGVTETNCNTYTDIQVSSLDEKVTANETNIATHYETVETQISGHENRIADLEIGMGDYEKFECIASVTLDEEVALISPALNGQYKELYWVFDVPGEPDTEKTEKARLFLSNQANATNSSPKLIQQGAAIVYVYKTTGWRVWISVKVVGNYAYSELWWQGVGTNLTSSSGTAYASVPDLNNHTGLTVPGKELTKDYIDELTIWMTSADNSRVFPAGTKYELWGVKA